MKRARYLITLCMLLTSGVAYASSGGEHIGWLLSVKWVNFAIYIAVLYCLLATNLFRNILNALSKTPIFERFIQYKPVGGSTITKGWSDRRSRIIDLVNRSERERKESQELLAAAQSKLRSLPDEVEQLKRAIKGEGESECQTILDEATKRAQRILDQSLLTIRSEEKVAESRLSEEYGAAVVSRAQEIVKSEFSEGNDKALRSTALSSIKGITI